MAEPRKVPKYQVRCMERIAEESATSIVYMQRYPYTVAVVGATVSQEHYVDFGACRCSWRDPFDAEKGQLIALGRALRSIALRTLGIRKRGGHIKYMHGIGTVLALDTEILAGNIPVANPETSDLEDDLNPLLVGA